MHNNAYGTTASGMDHNTLNLVGVIVKESASAVRVVVVI